MDLAALEDAFDVPASVAGAEPGVAALAIVASEVFRAAFGTFPSKLLVYHAMQVAREAGLPRGDAERVQAVVRALSSLVPLAERMATPAVASAVSRAAAAAFAMRGAQLEEHLGVKARLRPCTGEAPPAPTAAATGGRLYFRNGTSGNVVQVRGDVVAAFARVGAACLVGYVAALDNHWTRRAASKVAVLSDAPDALELADALLCPRHPEPSRHPVTVCRGAVRVRDDGGIDVHAGPVAIAAPLGTMRATWHVPVWLPHADWVAPFLGHAAEASLRSESLGSTGYERFLRRLDRRLAGREARYRDVRARMATGGGGDARDAIVAVDTRRSIMTALSVYVAACEAYDAGFRAPHLLTLPENEAWYRSLLAPALGVAHVSSVPEAFRGRRFDPDAYSELLKSPAFWARFRGAEHVLVVQDDGFLLDGRGLGRFKHYDYVGAPWAPENLPDLLALLGDNLVGNGGVSLRRVDAMRRIAEEKHPIADALFMNNLIVMPEDVFFTLRVRQLGGSVCPAGEAAEFSCEQVLPAPGRPVMAMHKVWHYFGAAGVVAVFDALSR